MCWDRCSGDHAVVEAAPLRRTEALRQRITQRLGAYPARFLAAPGLKRAAVVMVITDAGHGAALPGFTEHASWHDDAAFLLTRRAAVMNRHAGQWALPGGRLDAGETPPEAALREEISLVLDETALIGTLDDYATRSGYVITPVVAWAGAARELQPDPAEVESVHRIPLAELLRADAPLLDPPHEGHEHPVLRMPLGEHWVAAPTAAILYQFRERALLGRDTPVAHFDQPRFTWR